MPVARFEMPDGRIARFEVPDGTTPEQAQAMISEMVSQPNFGKQAAPAETYDPTEGMSTFEKGAAGFGKSLVDTYRGGKQIGAYLGNKIGLVSDETVAGIQAEIDEAKKRDESLMNTGAGLAGNVAGTIGTMLVPGVALKGASMLPNMGKLATAVRAVTAPETIKGAAALGAGMSALQPVATGESRLENAAFGAAAGGAGQAVGKVISRAIQPVQNVPKAKTEAARILQREGIPVAASQATGSRALQLTDAAFDNIPTTAGKQAAFRESQQKAFNRAILRRIGEDADEASEEVLANAYNRIGGVFESLTAGKTVKLDTRFLDDLAKVEGGQSKLFPSSQSSGIRSLIDDGINLATKGEVDGALLQAERSKLSKLASDAWRAGNNDMADAYSGIVEAIDNAVARSLPASEKIALNAARRQYGNLKVLEKIGVKGGNISPAKLSNALRVKNKKAFAIGKGDLVKLAKAGEEVLPAKVGDSGTAQRMMYQNILTGGAAGTLGGFATGDPMTALQAGAVGMVAPSAIRSLLYSKPVQSYLTSGLLNNVPSGALAVGRGGATLLPVGLLNALQE